MPDETETRSERLSIAVTPSELEALRLVERLHEPKYDGVSNVIRDFSISDAVRFAERARQIQAA